jgi:hypothetical protein
MAIIFRTIGPWGAGKGANLVAAEVDGNFYDLNTRLIVTEETIPTLVSIDHFSVSGNAFYIYMTDGTIQGPFALPQTTWNFRGTWRPSTNYMINDVTDYNGAVYMVLFNHISALVFDPGANDGSGHPYYGLMLEQPSSIIPPGGNTGQLLAKSSNADYAVNWQTPAIFPAMVLREAPDPTYTLTLADIAGYVRCVNASGCSITIPNDSTLSFPISAEISFRQCTDSPVTLVPGAAVILNAIAGLRPVTAKNGAVITAKKVDANTWDMFGFLSA